MHTRRHHRKHSKKSKHSRHSRRTRRRHGGKDNSKFWNALRTMSKSDCFNPTNRATFNRKVTQCTTDKWYRRMHPISCGQIEERIPLEAKCDKDYEEFAKETKKYSTQLKKDKINKELAYELEKSTNKLEELGEKQREKYKADLNALFSEY
jgi:hypothetical protein